jgi:protease-4
MSFNSLVFPAPWLRHVLERAIDATRRTVLNLLFLLILIILLSAPSSAAAPSRSAPRPRWCWTLKGDLVEQHSGTVRDAFMSNAARRRAQRSCSCATS